MSQRIMSHSEERIRRITRMYYSRPDIQKYLVEFSKNRESVPRFYDGFGKRPDTLEYEGDIMHLVNKGATSFHCSEELWKNPLLISTALSPQQLKEMRCGWDLLIDIDSKYIDYSKIAAELIIELLEFHGVRNIGVKFSGSKGFHVIVPWQAFPEEVNGVKTSNMFPEWPRVILKYIINRIEKELIKKISDIEKPSRYVRDFDAPKKVMPDIILVSPRHLFRMPYSLHEKTGLASIVIDKFRIAEFQLKDADPFKVKIKDFICKTKKHEAKELLLQALDWCHESEETKKDYSKEFTPIKLKNISKENFPPSIKKILEGVGDGRKRALFILINFLRSIGVEKKELEQEIQEWNKKNEVPLKEGYIKSQLSWSYRNKIIPPPNFEKDYYKGIGVIPTEEEMRYKNPLSYVAKKTLRKIRETENRRNPKIAGRKKKHNKF